MSRNHILRVIVLGAGASCSYSESPTGLRPPLARELISTYKKLDISENIFVLIGNIINYVRDTRGILPVDFLYWNEDLEKFFSEVDEQVTDMAKKLQNSERLTTKEKRKYWLAAGAYNQLIFLLASIFNEIQNGPLSKTYNLLADELDSNDVIITFNWDTLFERVLYSKKLWSPYNGYQIKPDSIFDNIWKKPEEFKYECDGISYLKLHGSTNWLTPFHSVNFSTGREFNMNKYLSDKLFVFLRSNISYKTYKNRYWGPYAPFSYCYYPPNLPSTNENVLKDVEEGIYSMPLIVPPVRNKQYKRFGQIFSTLWNLAEKSIEKCKQLYIIGYSFPKTDIVAREMFKNALNKNISLEKIIIINPHPKDIKNRFLGEFNVKTSKLEIRQREFKGTLKHIEKVL